MIDLYEEKVKRMSDEELIYECNFYGALMEFLATSNTKMSKPQKLRALMALKEATTRTGLEEERATLETAIKVLRLF